MTNKYISHINQLTLQEYQLILNIMNEEKESKSKEVLIKLLDQQIDINQTLKTQKLNLIENQRKLLNLLDTKQEEIQKLKSFYSNDQKDFSESKNQNPQQSALLIRKYQQLWQQYTNLLANQQLGSQKKSDKATIESVQDQLRLSLEEKQQIIKTSKKRVSDLEKKLEDMKKKFYQKQQLYLQQKSIMQRRIQAFQHEEIENMEILRKKQMQCEKLKQKVQSYNIIENQLAKIENEAEIMREKFNQELFQKQNLEKQLQTLQSQLNNKKSEFHKSEVRLMEWIKTIQQNHKKQEEQKIVLIKQKDRFEQERDYIVALHYSCEKKITTLKTELINKQKQFQLYKSQAAKRIRQLDNISKQKELRIIQLKNLVLAKKAKPLLSPQSSMNHQQCSKITSKIQKLGQQINQLKSIQSEFRKKPRLKTFLKIQIDDDNNEERVTVTQKQSAQTTKHSKRNGTQYMFAGSRFRQY